MVGKDFFERQLFNAESDHSVPPAYRIKKFDAAIVRCFTVSHIAHIANMQITFETLQNKTLNAFAYLRN